MKLATWLALAIVSTSAASQSVPAPADVLGFEPGADGRLASIEEIGTYFEFLARASNRVTFETVGRSTEGRPMQLAVLTSPENHLRLESIRQANVSLTDPRILANGSRDQTLAENPVIVLIHASIHSTEVGPAQASMGLAHFLATTDDAEWTAVLQNTVVLLVPCHNPDGYAKVTSWWNQHAHDPGRRGAPLPVLYHRYVGHDNNRDWFMFTQQETKVTVDALHRRWRPQIVIDQHQMGALGARMFVPPYQAPYEPNVPSLLVRNIDRLGRHVLQRLTEQGLTGLVTNQSFDGWTPARSYMHYHGAVRFLTEVASVDLADPRDRVPPPRGVARSADHPAPWTGGRWALADILRYTRCAALEVIRHAGLHRQEWLSDFHRIHVDAVEDRSGPQAFVIARDDGRETTTERLIEILRWADLELECTLDPLVMPSLETFAAGSVLVRRGQPYFAWARAMFERTPYPEVRDRPEGPIRRPYDVTSHHLPSLMNVRVEAVSAGPSLRSRPFGGEKAPVASSPRVGRFILDPRDVGAQADALRLLAGGHAVARSVGTVGTLPTGGFVVDAEAFEDPRSAPRSRAIPFTADSTVAPLRPVRIGFYESWTGSMDEGWTRFLFDDAKIPYRVARNAEVRAAVGLDGIDVLLMANLSPKQIDEGQQDAKLPEAFRGGLGEQGRAAVRSFVERGGTLLVLNQSSEWARMVFQLPWTEIQTGGRRLFPTEDGSVSLDVPGALLNTEVDFETDLSVGLSPSIPVFFWGARAFQVDAGAVGVQVPLRYAERDLVRVGYARGEERLAGKAAVVEVPVGSGRVIAFAFSPQFRNQTWGTLPLLMNALLRAGERKD